MSTKNLGRLRKVDLREAWTSEPGDFTPWLALEENLKLLGETIGIDLELESQEKDVGPFRADLLCKDTTSDSWVLIENQLERTDHSHLGQLLTYAAGLSAVTIVWIAERFTDEHRAAMDWLNEKTPEEINFFALEVELWRINDSAIAPKFNVVCKPNEWTRSVIRSRENLDSKQFCLDYWSGVLNAIRPSGILKETTKAFARQDMVFNVGWHSFVLKAYFSRPKRCGGVWLSCRGPSGLENYEQIKASRTEIERNIGHELEWSAYEDENRGSCLYPLKDVDVENTNDLPRQHEMFAEAVISLYKAVAPLVARLDARSEEPDE